MKQKKGSLEHRLARAEEDPAQSVREFVRRYAEELEALHGHYVLELGVGEGRNLLPFATRGFQVFGIERNEDALVIARTSLARKGISAELIQGNFWNLEVFPDQSCGIVLTNMAIQNSPTMGRVHEIFREVKRVLVPTGLFLMVENAEPFSHNWPRRRQGPLGFFTGEELEELTKRSGLHRIESGLFGLGPDKRIRDGRRKVWNLVFKKEIDL